MNFKVHLPLLELKRLERVEKDADRARRMRIIVLGLEGWTALAIAMTVGLSRRIYQRWVHRYNEWGLEGLADHRGRQPSSPLSPPPQLLRRIDGTCPAINALHWFHPGK